jgi:hypothetical protein
VFNERCSFLCSAKFVQNRRAVGFEGIVANPDTNNAGSPVSEWRVARSEAPLAADQT